MKFTIQKKTGLAVDALRALNGVDGLTATAELAATIGTTQPFLPQIMSPLVKAGWVESKRGPSGGYRLVADADAISALDLIEAVEGPTETGRCVLKGGPCGGETHCSLHAPWLAAKTALIDELAATPVLTVTNPD